MKEAITEKMKHQDVWYKDAVGVANAKEWTIFFKHLTKDYIHDYGTCCHAIIAAGLAAMWAAERALGGITGFQASIIGLELLSKWNNISGPFRIVKYDDMLFPQYDFKFKTIDKDTWDYLQKEAEKNLKHTEYVHPDVVAHWESIVKGVVPFGYTIEN